MEDVSPSREELRAKALDCPDGAFICTICGWESSGTKTTAEDACWNCGQDGLVPVEELRKVENVIEPPAPPKLKRKTARKTTRKRDS